jgi:uncharacterized membrane protein YebE (DUF533 family)
MFIDRTLLELRHTKASKYSNDIQGPDWRSITALLIEKTGLEEEAMFNFSDIVGMMVKGGMSRSSSSRLDHVLRSGGSSGGGLGGLLDGLTGGGGGGLGSLLGDLVRGGSRRGGGGLGGMLGSILGEASQSMDGRSNLALGGIGDLAGSVLGGGSGKRKGMGLGVMAMLGAMAFKALKGSRSAPEPSVPLGLREPVSDMERDELENNAGLVVRAMISAAKSDGRIDRQEMLHIIGKLQAEGLNQDAQAFIYDEMKRPLDLEGLCASAYGQQELAAQLYAASLLAIEIDTLSEKAYMDQLAKGLGLTAGTVRRLQQMVGLQQSE